MRACYSLEQRKKGLTLTQIQVGKNHEIKIQQAFILNKNFNNSLLFELLKCWPNGELKRFQ